MGDPKYAGVSKNQLANVSYLEIPILFKECLPMHEK
jgi:hypothetical protein